MPPKQPKKGKGKKVTVTDPTSAPAPTPAAPPNPEVQPVVDAHIANVGSEHFPGGYFPIPYTLTSPDGFLMVLVDVGQLFRCAGQQRPPPPMCTIACFRGTKVSGLRKGLHPARLFLLISSGVHCATQLPLLCCSI